VTPQPNEPLGQPRRLKYPGGGDAVLASWWGNRGDERRNLTRWPPKLVAEAVGLRTAPGRLARAADAADVEFDTQVVVKPATAGSSYGVTLVTEAGQLEQAVRTAARYDDRILIEEVVHGREIDVAVLREADGNR